MAIASKQTDPLTRSKSITSLNTISNILDSARKVLIEHGHTGFTTRKVSQLAGISPGNLSYHFPNKNQLLQALITRMLDEYLCNFEVALNIGSDQDNIGLEALIDWLMKDAVSTATVRTFRELWAMALHDEAISRMVDRFYDETIERTTALIANAYPNLAITKISDVVNLIAMVTEGAIVLYGTQEARQIGYDKVRQYVVTICAKEMAS
ncbi:TetR/AcrR family transcriptional regulator [Chitinibacter bivalviorum]|uniref:TetR/AcrR family transcriptional regulator n=1 Tax=Chitinibacter bivalviorum TaxID=2739434 RepID=A0A7H9BKM4_9NEIS|nr:TetR/AcrR family transcriptional regulator [Chitinibacter bivalviorum]QLG88034.1 TetR/AcrR family transcriptional regulator [Chitinibacter bivalviorum]